VVWTLKSKKSEKVWDTTTRSMSRSRDGTRWRIACGSLRLRLLSGGVQGEQQGGEEESGCRARGAEHVARGW
jgi:hypothetical protein